MTKRKIRDQSLQALVAAERRKNKYGNKKCEADGIVFDSHAEREFYWVIKSELDSGLLSSYDYHKHFEILPTIKKFGRTIRGASYTPDFILHYADGHDEYIEVKGARCIINQASGLRMKLFDHRYPEYRLRIWTPSGGYIS